MASPPFNLSNWKQDKLKDDKRWKYGTPPAENANYAWIQHMIYYLAPNGKIGLVLANGALSSQASGEGEIRKVKYIYEVTVTPKRGDGLEKINYTLIGPIRYSYTAKEKAME